MKRIPERMVMAGMLALLFLCGCFGPAQQDVEIPRPKSLVEDRAGVMDDAAEQKLERILSELERKARVQYVVMTIATVNGEDVAMTATEHAHRWKLGDEKKDTGIFTLVVIDERKDFTAVGMGLEGCLPDSKVGELRRSYLIPHLKRNDFTRGIYDFSIAVAAVAATEMDATLSASPPDSKYHRTSSRRPAMGIGGLIFFIIMVFVLSRSGPLGWLILLSGSGRSYGSWGGGFRGGSSGGFSGGFGGGFSGGGAGGSW